MEIDEAGHAAKIQPQQPNHYGDKTVVKKASNDGFDRMNHLTRLWDFDVPDYERRMLLRVKKFGSFLPSNFSLLSIQDIKDELEAKKKVAQRV